eukprot:1748079-Rhodomonas_salina.1
MDETDMTAPPLIDTNFLIKELWDPQMQADFVFCLFEGPRMTECQQEINNVLRREWIPFKHFKLHPASNEESWITNRCASPVWYYGLQGWYILTGLIKSHKVNVQFNFKWMCYEMSATEQAKRLCTDAQMNLSSNLPLPNPLQCEPPRN